MNQTPTQHPEVNTLLQQLSETLQLILEEQLVGMYLFGSLTSGTFDEFSDIDILVVTAREITKDQFQALKSAHQRLQESGSYWATQLEVVYISTAALRRYDPANNCHPHIDRGQGEVLHYTDHDEDWIVQRYNLQESGIVVSGPHPRELIDPLTPEDLKAASRAMLSKWGPWLESNPHLLESRGYQTYVVLTLCRILCGLETGTYTTKPAAAAWAQKQLPDHWHPLITRALKGRQQPGKDPVEGDIQATWALLQYIQERGGVEDC